MNKELFIKRLKDTMEIADIKQVELARLTNITPSSISDWLKGKYLPKQDKVNKIAGCLNVDVMWLLGYSNENNNAKNNEYEIDDEDIYNSISKIPLVGTICAGDGVYAEENLEDYMYVDQATRADFALRVKGDSMIEAGIFDGDIVFIKKQQYISNGKIAAVLLTENNEASLKKFYKKQDHVVLQPCNSNYEPIITRNVMIIGECVGVYRSF